MSNIDRIAIIDDCQYMDSYFDPWTELRLARKMIVAPKALLATTPSVKPENDWMHRAYKDATQAAASTWQGLGYIDGFGMGDEPLNPFESERELGITISSNPHYSPNFGKSTLTAAIGAVINGKRESHQLQQDLIAARSGKYCSHNALQSYQLLNQDVDDPRLRAFSLHMEALRETVLMGYSEGVIYKGAV